MKIAFILHDLNLTGAARLGLQVARVMARSHDVKLVAKRDGPLRETIPEGLFRDLVITDTNHEDCDESLDSRVANASQWLKESDPDLVYVNSIAAADWVGAARQSAHRSVLHIHEMLREISNLRLSNVFDGYDVGHSDRILAASRECLEAVRSAFSIPAEKLTNFGVCVDVPDIEAKSRDKPAAAVRHDGELLDYRGKPDRKLIAMCGLAQHRKGADLFWETARISPEHDFLWIGPWDDPNSELVNPALPLNSQMPLDNLYWTNTTTNPYSAMARADLFALTSREDPNPLVVPEAISLGRPVVTFAASGGAHEWTSRHGLSLSGKPDPQRLADFARHFFSMKQLDWTPGPAFFQEADLEAKTTELLNSLN